MPATGFPESGWLSPEAVCAAVTSPTKISLCWSSVATSLCEGRVSDWDALRSAVPASQLVSAQSSQRDHAGKTLQQLDWLPAQRIRGQITRLPASPDCTGLKAVLCHEGYMTPARGQHHIIGATYDIGDKEPACRAKADHRHNLNRLAKAVPQWHTYLASIDERELNGYVGFRYASPDYLPNGRTSA